MTTATPIRDVVPGDVAVLPTTIDGATTDRIVVEWVREAPDGTVGVGWHGHGEDHQLWLPLHLAARGALVLTPDAAAPHPQAA